MEACKEALNNEGISVLQPVQSGPTDDFVETILLHESGEFITSEMKLILTKQDMQAYGSAVSYARRYSLQSLVFIPAEDDDGEKSMSRTNQFKDRSKANPESRNDTLTEEQKKEMKDITKYIKTGSGILETPGVPMVSTITVVEDKPTNRRTSFRQPKVVEQTTVVVTNDDSKVTELNF
jgi:hypothetical protein